MSEVSGTLKKKNHLGIRKGSASGMLKKIMAIPRKDLVE